MNLPVPRAVHLGQGVSLEIRVENVGSDFLVRLVRHAGDHSAPAVVLELRGFHAVELGAGVTTRGPSRLGDRAMTPQNVRTFSFRPPYVIQGTTPVYRAYEFGDLT